MLASHTDHKTDGSSAVGTQRLDLKPWDIKQLV